MQRFYKEAIPALGHEVFVVGTGRELADLCRDVRPELVITDLKLPELDALAVAAQVCRDWTIPFIIVSECHDPEIIRGSPDGPVLAYLVKPIHQNSLGPAITVAMQCFQRMRALWDEAARLRQTVEDRKLIERAKGMVMKYAGLDEEAAFNRMKKLASDQNRKLAEIAHAIITSGEVFHQLEKVGECKASNGGPARRVKGRRPAWHDYHDGHDERTPRSAD
jgi:response regulator NasT